MNTRNLILLAALLAASFAAGYQFYTSRPQPVGYAKVVAEKKLPATRPVFALPDVNGNERSITEWDGKALVVNFWATWCPPCLREIPMLIEARDELAAREIEIIGIAMDDPAAVHEFASRTSFNYPVLVGEQEAVDAAEAFGADVIALPITVFTNHAGEVIEIHAGELHREQLDAAIAKLR
ncbi:MAG: TlpA family protein disulfide reductase [Gammaproteobacteria bacterium]|nr:TlpA family protein disulfide reductase [Gammaproteobacteria bacterium]NNF61427.1 TlpA family protein disulfide reductase [Gammaproteobacteria bacterium]NNM20999.1 TlpA family protein disulfide reductase [Gammaproteobacteria bacterium]